MILPWRLRRRLLVTALGYELHPSSRIGFSLLVPDQLVLDAGARIGHLNGARGLTRIQLGPCAEIGNMNYITGEPLGAPLYRDQPDRRPELLLAEHSAITSRHLIDCTDSVSIGRFGLIAGWRTLILSHGFDISTGKQRCAPVRIGDYAVVSTNSVVLAGASLPDYSVLGAMSLLKGKLDDPYRLYAGHPAREVGTYEPAAAYFNRTSGPLS